MWNTVLSQSFADRLWCGQNREVVDNGRSQDQFGPEGPEVSTSAAWRSRLYGARLKADGLLAIRTESWKSRTQPIVRRLRAGGRRIRTLGPSSDGEHDSALILSSPPRRCASLRLRARRLIKRCSRDAICSARGYSALQCSANSSGVVLSAPPQFSSETIGRSSSNRPRHRNAGVVECR